MNADIALKILLLVMIILLHIIINNVKIWVKFPKTDKM
jgi:hypothetical protein